MNDIPKSREEIAVELEAMRRKIAGMEESFLQYENLIDKISNAKKAWEKTFDVVPDSFAIIGKDHSILRINRTMADLLGLTPEQCIGQKCHKLVHGTDAPPFYCPHIRTMRDSREHRIEVYEKVLGGTTIITTLPMTGENGELTGSVHVAYDINAAANLEESLLDLHRNVEDTNKDLQVAYSWMRNSRDMLRKHQYEQDTCFLVDREGNVEWLSDRTLSFTGKARTEMIGSSLIDLFVAADRDKVRDAVKEAWLGFIYPIRSRVATSDESDCDVIVKLTRMTSNGSRALLVELLSPEKDAILRNNSF